MSGKKKIFITGADGMLAHDFIESQSEQFQMIPLTKDQCDIRDFSSILKVIQGGQPDLILNCAAYTAVDDAEDIGMKINYEVNTLGNYNLARATRIAGVHFITISTDYVFDGEKEGGYLPDDTCNPISAYGMSKYLGERLVRSENAGTVIIRTSWLYGGVEGQKNFVNTILRIANMRHDLKVVDDQHGIPTYSVDLAGAIAQVIHAFEVYKGKILHLSNSCHNGNITWYDFAKEIIHLTHRNNKITPCMTNEYPTKAKRPIYSILLNDSDILLPDWKSGLARYLGK